MEIEDVKEQITKDNYIITFHARRRMDERGIYNDDLVNLILDRSIIEDYPESKPCPSALISYAITTLRIITVYWPEGNEWIDHTTRR